MVNWEDIEGAHGGEPERTYRASYYIEEEGSERITASVVACRVCGALVLGLYEEEHLEWHKKQ